jgi:hypothetical protein
MVSMNLGKASISCSCRYLMLESREITKSRSILPLQPTGGPPTSGIVPRSKICVVPPLLDSPELLAAVDVELLSPPDPALSAAASPVDATELVVITGAVENPDESDAGPWHAPSTAKRDARVDRGATSRP